MPHTSATPDYPSTAATATVGNPNTGPQRYPELFSQAWQCDYTINENLCKAVVSMSTVDGASRFHFEWIVAGTHLDWFMRPSQHS